MGELNYCFVPVATQYSFVVPVHAGDEEPLSGTRWSILTSSRTCTYRLLLLLLLLDAVYSGIPMVLEECFQHCPQNNAYQHDLEHATGMSISAEQSRAEGRDGIAGFCFAHWSGYWPGYWSGVYELLSVW